MSDFQKVLFVQDRGEGKFEIESLWCLKDGDHYIIDNIPFIAKNISLGDTIKVEYDTDEKAYYFEDLVAVSGNTTVRLFFESDELIADTRKALLEYGCESEAFLARNIVAVNIPKDVDYLPVKAFLDKGEHDNKWEYEESCLEHAYQNGS